MANKIDLQTQSAANAFKVKLAHHFDVQETLLFGSRARQTQHSESDADVAVLLRGEAGKFIDTKFAMDDLAYEVLLETGIRIQPLPRAYYAMFDAARAVLSWANLSTKSKTYVCWPTTKATRSK